MRIKNFLGINDSILRKAVSDADCFEERQGTLTNLCEELSYSLSSAALLPDDSRRLGTLLT